MMQSSELGLKAPGEGGRRTHLLLKAGKETFPRPGVQKSRCAAMFGEQEAALTTPHPRGRY